MITSAILQENILKLLSDGKPYSVQEIKAYLLEIGVEGYSEGQFAGSMNTLQRNGTLKKTERGIYTLRQEEDKHLKTCFVVSPIGDEKSDIRKNADQLFKHIILPVCENCGFIAERVDQMNDADSITQKILDSLESADLVIADITGHNPNVFYEMGFRKRTNKPIVHLRKHGEHLPFDIAAIRTLDYNLTDLDSVESTKDRLEKIICSFTFLSSDNPIGESNDLANENVASPILPILYQIIDAISELQTEVKNNNSNALETVINTMQKAQLKKSQEDVLMAQLLPAMLENPKMLNQLLELREKYPTQQNRKNLRR